MDIGIPAQAFELLQSDSVKRLPSEWNLPKTLRKEPRSPQTQTLARLAARASLRDTGQGLQSLGPIPLRQLIDYSGTEPCERSPAAISGRKIELNDLGAARQYSSLQNDRGSTQISEALLLPKRNLRGCNGRSWPKANTRDGRTIAHFDEPADAWCFGQRQQVHHNGSSRRRMGLSRVDCPISQDCSMVSCWMNRFTTTRRMRCDMALDGTSDPASPVTHQRLS